MALISCIIPTKHRLDDLKETVLSILSQNYNTLEILILDSNSESKISDEISLFLRSLQAEVKIKHLVAPFQSPSHARNEGVRASEGEYIALLDDDILLEPNFFESATKCISDSGIDGVNGVNLLDKDSILARIFYLGSFKDVRARKDAYGKPTRYLSTNCSILKKEVFKDFQFDEAYVGYSYAEDIDFSYRASARYKFTIDGGAKLIHKASLKGRKPNKVYNNMKLYGTFYFYFKNIYPNEVILFLIRLFPLALSSRSLSFFLKSYWTFLKFLTLKNPSAAAMQRYNSFSS